MQKRERSKPNKTNQRSNNTNQADSGDPKNDPKRPMIVGEKEDEQHDAEQKVRRAVEPGAEAAFYVEAPRKESVK
ncbi:hypothetical protein SDC9_180840 [bioreactor metagenome]|uniref:Uncharacterized protein n=1 Tax=bioreactor metagenome TaxID=1076179 RepID=A0A645HB77_9ZZZZ